MPLRLFTFSTDTPLYVATYWEDVEPERAKKVHYLTARHCSRACVHPTRLRPAGHAASQLAAHTCACGTPCNILSVSHPTRSVSAR